MVEKVKSKRSSSRRGSHKSARIAGAASISTASNSDSNRAPGKAEHIFKIIGSVNNNKPSDSQILFDFISLKSATASGIRTAGWLFNNIRYGFKQNRMELLSLLMCKVLAPYLIDKLREQMQNNDWANPENS